MPGVCIPSLLGDLTGGAEQVMAPGESVRQLVDELDARFPGIRERLCEGDRLRPTILLIVDGAVSRQRMRQTLNDDSEVHFLPAIGGGQCD
jgi:sulfur-carrier protein